MNLRKICPDIPDNWKGSITDSCRVLAEDGKRLSADTLRKYARLGKRNGGLDWKPSKSGKMMFTGKEIKRLRREY